VAGSGNLASRDAVVYQSSHWAGRDLVEDKNDALEG
jgi:hypothetical protein